MTENFPRKPVETLRSTLASLHVRQDVRTLPASALPTLIDNEEEEDATTTTPAPPLSCLELVGYFPTAEWREDPTMPDFCAFHNYNLGWYSVADVRLTDGAGKTTPLTLVVNAGDADCNSGYWGGIFSRTNSTSVGDEYTAVARLWSTGDTETTVRQQEAEAAGAAGAAANTTPIWFTPFAKNTLHFPNSTPREDEEDEDEEPLPYFSGLSPGVCETQLEKLLGIAVHTVMSSRAWRRLPVQLRKTTTT